jgi:hypothetical protein
MFLYTLNLIPKIPARILRKHCQITFLRTFGSRRPPTVPVRLHLGSASVRLGNVPRLHQVSHDIETRPPIHV